MNKNTKAKLCAAVLAGVLTLSACDKTGLQGSTPSASTQSTENAQTTAQTTQANKKPNYTELECESPKNYAYVNLVCGESSMAINMALPEEWKLYKDGGKCYTVSKYGKEIGKLYLGEQSERDEGKTEVYSDTKTSLGIETL